MSMFSGPASAECESDLVLDILLMGRLWPKALELLIVGRCEGTVLVGAP